jgi:excinuclease UvrABC nuclease subunit
MKLCEIESAFVFSRSNIELNAPTKAGIYTFWSGKYCVYVGQAKNIRERLLTHWKSSHNKELSIWISARGSQLCISTQTVSGDLSKAEQSQINRYKPQ